MLLEGAKNMDLLLGVLVYGAWGHYSICAKPVITVIVHLAISLADDLGLLKPVPMEPSGVMLNYSAQGCPKPPPAKSYGSTRTIGERRAAIGLFLLSST
jgi:hypothetical protein